jgi:hypothetical protein
MKNRPEVNKWIHIEDLGGDPWVLPIWKSIHNAKESGKVKQFSPRMSEMGSHISTRLDMINYSRVILSKTLSNVYDYVNAHSSPENVFTNERESVALRVLPELKFSLLLEIDSLLFEVNAGCELMKEYLGEIYDHVGKDYDRKKLGIELKNIIEAGAGEAEWFRLLDRSRNYFSHNGTPYIAIDISKEGLSDILIMKENLKEFIDKEKFFTTNDLTKIVEGFDMAKSYLRDHIISLYEGL